MTFVESVSVCFKKGITFSGRASRSEFWWFMLFQSIGPLVIMMILMTMDLYVVALLVYLALLVPMFAASARRLHDLGRSGWWQLLWMSGPGSFVLLYWLTQPSAEGSNQYNTLAVA